MATDDDRFEIVRRKVKNIMEAAKQSPENPTPQAGVSINLTGGRGHQVVGGDFYDQSVRVEKLVPPPVTVKTGDGVLNAGQKAKLTALVRDIVDASKAKRTPLAYGTVWSKLNTHMRVNKYDEILQDDFEKASAYLLRERAMLLKIPSAHKKNPDWRRRRIAAVHARCNERGWQEWRRAYMKEKFGRESMDQMPDSELESLYRAVMAKK